MTCRPFWRGGTLPDKRIDLTHPGDALRCGRSPRRSYAVRQARGIEAHDDRRAMKRVLFTFFSVVLAICLFACLGQVFSPRSRLAGVAELAVVMVLAIAWILALRRSRAATGRRAVPPRTSAGAADLDEATSLRNQPTCRDDVNGRVGPEWSIAGQAVGGSWPATRIVLIAFPDNAAAKAWHASPEHQAIAQ